MYGRHLSGMHGYTKHFKSKISGCYIMRPNVTPNTNFLEQLEIVNKQLQVKPDDPISLMNKGLILTHLNGPEKGLPYMEKAEEIATNENNTDALAELYSFKGISALMSHRLKDALSHFKQSLKINPNNGFTYFSMGVLLTEMEKYEDAIHHFDHAIKLQCTIREAYFRKALALNLCKKHISALKCLREILREYPDDADARCEMGITLAVLKKFKYAIICFRKVIRQEPRHMYAHIGLSAAYIETKEYHLAKRYVDRALRLDPTDKNVLMLQRSLKKMDVYR